MEMMACRLTSGVEDWGFGDSPEAAIADAIANCAHPETGGEINREWIDAQLAIGREGVVGRGLVIEKGDELESALELGD